MAGATRSTEELVCPECGKKFAGPQAFGGHRYRAHGVKSAERLRRERLGQRQKTDAAKERRQTEAKRLPIHTPESLAREATYASNVRRSLRELVTPLHDQLAEIDARLRVIESEARDLREARKEIVSVLGKLDPTTRSASPKTPQGEAVADANAARAKRWLDAKSDAVEKILREEGEDYAEGFTASLLTDRLSTRVPRGLSMKSARQVIDELRERGLVRADRVTRGGGMNFKLVTSTNGASDG